MMTRTEALFVVARIVFPSKKTAIVKSRSVRNPIGVRNGPQPETSTFLECFQGLPYVEMVSTPDLDADRTVVLLKQKGRSGWRGNEPQRGLSYGFV